MSEDPDHRAALRRYLLSDATSLLGDSVVMIARTLTELADLDGGGAGIDDTDLPPAAELLSQLIQSRAAPAQQRVNRLVWEGVNEALSAG